MPVAVSLSRRRPLVLATIALLLGLLAPCVSRASATMIHPGATTTATVRLVGRSQVLLHLTTARYPVRPSIAAALLVHTLTFLLALDTA